MTKLLAENLRKFYDRREVVKNVSLAVSGGEIVGLLGPNGAGKTTAFYIITGLVSTDGGSVRLGSMDIGKLPMHKRAAAGLGYLPQESSVFRGLTVFENLYAVAEYLPVSDNGRRKIVETKLEEMKISHLAGQMAYTLSGGERRRLEIARTLIMDPKFLLMDEPFSGVDPISISDLQGIIISLKQRNIGILITDHNVRDTLKIVDRAYLIHGGKVLCSGTRDTLLSDENSKKFYLGSDFTM
ncbi:MAG: LPS export ABC transporter ATP-binding protein [Puniceicoccales bacterium]|jgi:lipopolysaccharide export system ATP-binding protein|nr:LPS export ABC transporter ATP-binding protein [Puniceicoccales bacterium]